jgi:hypothetical protein
MPTSFLTVIGDRPSSRPDATNASTCSLRRSSRSTSPNPLFRAATWYEYVVAVDLAIDRCDAFHVPNLSSSAPTVRGAAPSSPSPIVNCFASASRFRTASSSVAADPTTLRSRPVPTTSRYPGRHDHGRIATLSPAGLRSPRPGPGSRAGPARSGCCRMAFLPPKTRPAPPPSRTLYLGFADASGCFCLVFWRFPGRGRGGSGSPALTVRTRRRGPLASSVPHLPRRGETPGTPRPGHCLRASHGPIPATRPELRDTFGPSRDSAGLHEGRATRTSGVTVSDRPSPRDPETRTYPRETLGLPESARPTRVWTTPCIVILVRGRRRPAI